MVIKHEIVLDDKVSAPAKSASASVSSVSREMTVLSKALQSANDKMTKAAATGNISAFRSAKTDVTNLTAAIGQLKPKIDAEAAAMQKLKDAHASASAHFAKTGSAAQSAAGATQQFGAAADGAAGSSGGLQAELAEVTGGLSLVVEAVGAVVFAFGALTLAGAAFAIKASEAKQASLSLWSALGKGVVTGEEIDDLLDDMRTKTGLTKDALAPLTEGFLRMGVTGKDALEKLTVAAASAEALAKGGGEAFTKLYQQAKVAGETGAKMSIPFKKLESQLVGMGLNVDDLSSAMGMSSAKLVSGLKAGTIDAKKFGDAMQEAVTKKGAGPLENMALTTANLGKLLQEYLGDLFEDMGKDIKPFLAEVKSLFSILDSKANPSGKALKEGIEAFFKNVFAQATKVVPMIKHFLLDVIIYGLKAYIAIKPIIGWFKQLGQNQTVMSALTGAMKVLGVILLVIGAAVAAVVLVLLAAWAASVVLVVGVYALIAAFGEFITGVGKSIVEWVSGAASAASDFVMGLVNGIKNGTGMVIEAVTALGSSAIGGLKKVLGIASPSKVMMQLGGHTATGFTEGLDNAGPQVQAAAGAMAGGAIAGAGGAASAPAASGGGGGGSNINVVINVDGGGKSWQEVTEEAFAILLERLALQGGM